MKKVFVLSLLAASFITNADAQLLKKIKNKIAGAQENTSGNNTASAADAPKSSLTDFQRSKLGKIVFFDKDQVDVDWTGESAADCITEIELGKPLCMRTYFDNGGWNVEKDGMLDVRYTVDGQSFTGRDMRKYAYAQVEKVPSKNTFGRFVKFENGAYPVHAITGVKNKQMVTPTLVSPRGQYWQSLTNPEDALRLFLATKLKSKVVPGSTINLKVEFYKTKDAYYSKSSTPVDGEVFATGEIKLKVTAAIKQANNCYYRMFAEGLQDKALADASAKQIETKFPTTVKKVHKVYFLDNDFLIKRDYNGNIVSRSIQGWVVFETHEGVFFNTKTEFIYQYNGSGYNSTPLDMNSCIQEATFPILGTAFGK
jgi:hypothetical protein